MKPARQPYAASVHLVSYPIPTSERLFTRRYVALLIVVAAVLVWINLPTDPLSSSCAGATLVGK